VSAEPQDREVGDDRGGDAACWANLVCEECGAVQGDAHREGCTRDPGPVTRRRPDAPPVRAGSSDATQ
jgi:hypothetical protein